MRIEKKQHGSKGKFRFLTIIKSLRFPDIKRAELSS